MLPYHRHLSHQAPSLATTDDFPEKAVSVVLTEAASTLKVVEAAVTATPTRTSRWDTHKTTTNSAELQIKVVVVCLHRSLDEEDPCNNIRIHHTRRTAALR